MDAKIITPFLDAVAKVMPELGFQEVKRGRMSVGAGNKVTNLGVMVVVGLTHEYPGNIIYNLTEESAKQIASKMMMGMPVPIFDDMAESAISELGNMLAANAAMIFEGQGVKMDISPPTVISGESMLSTSASRQQIIIEMLIDAIPLEVNISIAC